MKITTYATLEPGDMHFTDIAKFTYVMERNVFERACELPEFRLGNAYKSVVSNSPITDNRIEVGPSPIPISIAENWQEYKPAEKTKQGVGVPVCPIFSL